MRDSIAPPLDRVLTGPASPQPDRPTSRRSISSVSLARKSMLVAFDAEASTLIFPVISGSCSATTTVEGITDLRALQEYTATRAQRVRPQIRSTPAALLDHLTGLIAIGGDALEDSEQLYGESA